MTTPDIFLSYNREDIEVARGYATSLEAAGFTVWWDQVINSGQTYDQVTEAALRGARAVVVLWSPRSVVSRWVRSEATIADRNGTMVPVTIETCERPVMFELTQTADHTAWRGDPGDPVWLAFLRDLDRRLGREAAPRHAPEVKLELPEMPSIAVLPFANVGGDPEQAYFVDGLMEEITTALARIRTMFVISSGSTLALRGHNLTPVEAAKKLGVHYVLEGNVRAAGGRVRIAAKLIDGQTGSQIWADRFEDTMDDIFALQDKVAEGVAGVTEFSVQKSETAAGSKRPTSDLRAYDYYLRALGPFRTYEKDNLFLSLDLLNKALEIDPKYALAHSLAAGVYAVTLQFGWSEDPDATVRKLVESVEMSLQNGQDDPQVLASAAFPYWLNGRFDEALQMAQRACALNPGSSFPLIALGQLAATAGDLETAERCIEQSMRLDPFSPNRALQLAALAQTRYVQGRYAEATELALEWSHINKSPLSVGLLAAASARLGQTERAKSALIELKRLTDVPMEHVAATMFRLEEHRQLFLDALAIEA
jgi:TolB-like protein/Tfp pilus assembly protein PilF